MIQITLPTGRRVKLDEVEWDYLRRLVGFPPAQPEPKEPKLRLPDGRKTS